MIKIGIDGHMLGDHSGGNESYYSNILMNMEIPDGWKLYLFVNKDVDVSVYKNKFEIIRFKSKSACIRNFLELSILCKTYKLDLLHTQYFIPFWRPCKILCTIHDICFEHYKDIFTKKEYYRQRFLIPYAAKHSAKVFVASHFTKNDIIEHYHIAENKVVVTHCAVNSSFRKLTEKEINSKELREKYNIGTCDYILSVCNLQPRKNLARLIRSFIKMKNEIESNVKLIVVGKKAWMYNDILKAALDGSQDIIFTDYVSVTDLVRLYNEAKCFVYPSFFEGFGIPPLEAMACSIPVAVANATSLPEVVGGAGLYFDPYNEDEIEQMMIKLLTDESLQEELIQKGIHQTKNFNWKKSSDIVLSTYFQMVKSNENK